MSSPTLPTNQCRSPTGARLLAQVLALSLACVIGTGSLAQTSQESASYTVSISGIPIGSFSLAANRNGAAYAVKARAASGGLAGILRPFSLVSSVRGLERNGLYSPQSYVSQSEGARAGRGGELAFEAGLPVVIRADEERAPDAPVVDPATQKGAVDPLTALYVVLRDTTPADACALDLRLFDGHRGSRMTLSDPQPAGDGITCTGLYRRIDGYPPKDLAQRPTFAFSVTYQPAANGQLRATDLTLDSSYGPARMTRD